MGVGEDRLERLPQVRAGLDRRPLGGGVAPRPSDLGDLGGGTHPHTEEAEVIARPLAGLGLPQAVLDRP